MNDTVALLSDLEKLLQYPRCEVCGFCHWCNKQLDEGHDADCPWVRTYGKLTSLMAMP